MYSYITITTTCNILHIFLICSGIRSTGAPRHRSQQQKVSVKVLQSRHYSMLNCSIGCISLFSQVLLQESKKMEILVESQGCGTFQLLANHFQKISFEYYPNTRGIVGLCQFRGTNLRVSHHDVIHL